MSERCRFADSPFRDTNKYTKRARPITLSLAPLPPPPSRRRRPAPSSLRLALPLASSSSSLISPSRWRIVLLLSLAFVSIYLGAVAFTLSRGFFRVTPPLYGIAINPGVGEGVDQHRRRRRRRRHHHRGELLTIKEP